MATNGLGGIFENDDYGKGTSDLNEVMTFMTEAIRADRLTIPDAIEALLNLVKPGRTDDSHDILREFRTAMAVQGFNEVGGNVECLWLTIFPWGMGFHMGFAVDYPVEAISHDAKQAIIKSLCAILVQGGVDAEISPNGKIKITTDDGEQNVDIDDVVTRFRKEIDDELGPSKDETPKVEFGEATQGEVEEAVTDWLKRWMQ